MTLYQVVISSLFNQQTKSQREDYRAWVTSFVNDSINQLSSLFIKADGSNQPSNDIDFNQKTITNIRKSSHVNDPIVRKELNTTNDLVNSMFHNKTTPLAIKPPQATLNMEVTVATEK